MAATQNGFKQLARSSVSKLTRIKAGTHTTQVLKGDVAVVLGWFVREFNATVEPVTTLYGWRSVEDNRSVGGSSDSNHVSGTAVDVNGGRHPWEQRAGRILPSGFTSTQVSRIRLLQKACRVIHWGGDYNVRFRDWMHFDVRGSSSQVKAAAKKLRGGTVTVTVNGLRGRKSPSTSAALLKDKHGRVIHRNKGFRIVYVDVVCRGGRLWLKTNYGNWYAAEYTTF